MLKFGIISDVQYADIPNGFSFAGVPRYYRASIQSLRRAVSWWKTEKTEFCIHLGDILDGFNPPEKADEALERVVSEFDRLAKPHYHMLGNHCLYNHSRKILNKRLRMGDPDGISYYSFSPHDRWRFLVLDGYDVSMLGWPAGHSRHEQARKILEERNPNENKNNPSRPPGTSPMERRFVMFGGGLSEEQLGWLRSELGSCRSSRQRAILFCHLPLHPGTCSPTCLLWNYEDVLATVDSFADVCVATFAGHAHWDGEYTDSNGVFHRVLKGVIETQEDEDCAGIIELSESHLQLTGSGGLASAKVLFRSSPR